MKAHTAALALMGGTALALAIGAGQASAQDDDVYCTFGDVADRAAASERFDRLDIDDDDRVTLAELEACLDAFEITGAERERYVREFGELDAEGDDVLAAAEIEAVGRGARATPDIPRETAAMATDPAVTEEGVALEAEIVTLAGWRYDDLYAEGVSAEEWIDEGEIFSVDGEEIGDLEDIIVGQDGRILAIVAEVGGFWYIGDTHVSVPWDEVTVNGFAIEIPVTEETVEDYDVFDREWLTADAVSNRMIGGVDAADLGGRAYRLSELIGDHARLRGDDDSPVNYGYVRDVILRGGEVAAVVVNPRAGFGTTGYYAYPYYGYGYAPGSRYYDMPYTEREARGMEPLDDERF